MLSNKLEDCLVLVLNHCDGDLRDQCCETVGNDFLVGLLALSLTHVAQTGKVSCS